MNKILKLTVCGLAITGLAVGSYAATILVGKGGAGKADNSPFTGPLFQSTSTTNAATVLSYAILTAKSVNGGVPVVTHAEATSDLISAKLQFYRVTGITRVGYTNSTVTIPVDQTNGIAEGSAVVIIRHFADDSYEKRILTTSTGATNIVTTVAPLGTCVPGDLVYRAVTAGAGFLPFTGTNTGIASSLSWRYDNAGGIFTGQAEVPLLVEIDGTSAATLQLLTAEYRANPR